MLKPHGKYLYGINENVMTLYELEKKLQENSFKNNKIVMIQCVGARDETHTDCSRLCCIETIKNAITLKKQNSKADISILYRDMMSFGKYEEYYRESQEKFGIKYFRYLEDRPPKVKEQNGKLVVTTYDAMLGNWVEFPADKIVLTTPHIPSEGTDELQQILKVSRSPIGFFMEAHAKLRPSEFTQEGIYLCGQCQGPKELPTIIAQASGAASKACSLISKKFIETEPITAEVDREQCIGCELCNRLCPFGALEYVDGKANVVEAICKGCGICAASCPVSAIQMPYFKDEQILAQISAIFEERYTEVLKKENG